MTYNGRIPRFLGVLSAVALSACVDSGPATPLSPPEDARFATGASATLLECESLTSVSASGLIDALGGTLRVTDDVGGVHEVVFPANAVRVPTRFTLTVPASKYVEVRVIASDPVTGAMYQKVDFPADAQPTLAVSYKRCTRSNVLSKALALYNIHEVTDAVLEGPFGGKSGSTSDPRVVGKVPHFTDYAIGQP